MRPLHALPQRERGAVRRAGTDTADYSARTNGVTPGNARTVALSPEERENPRGGGNAQSGPVVIFLWLRLLSSMVAEEWASELKARSTYLVVLHGRNLGKKDGKCEP